LDEGVLARVSSSFPEAAFAAENLGSLRAAMQQALTEDGLFADEAQAMLDTWGAAYFQTPGLRLFFTVPQEWTDHYLPFEFSRPVALTRVLVGRIEIVAPQQRDLLARIASSPVLPFPADELDKKYRANSDLYRHLARGETKVTELGLALPESYEEQGAALPLSLTLAQNHPNPFNSQTLIQYGLPQAAPVELRVYSLAGQLVARLVQGHRPAGEYTVYWDGRDVAGGPLGTGVYVYRLSWEKQALSRKLLLLR
jgi:hypothetical protein